MKTWRDKTCQHCIYRKDTECRINPPTSVQSGYRMIPHYPLVFTPAHTDRSYLMPEVEKPDYYTDACAKYKERTKR